jgi:hypothetical protein
MKVAEPRLRNYTQKVDRELFRLQDHEPSTYKIDNFNSTELDVSVSAQLAVKLIESPVPQKQKQPKVSSPRCALCAQSRFCTDNSALQQSK